MTDEEKRKAVAEIILTFFRKVKNLRRRAESKSLFNEKLKDLALNAIDQVDKLFDS